MSTSQLTWVVLDELVPPEDTAAAQTALIRRDPELSSLVAQGALTETDAIEALRGRHDRYGAPRRRPLLGRRVLVLLIAAFLVWVGVSSHRASVDGRSAPTTSITERSSP